jgi:hypothetical protein
LGRIFAGGPWQEGGRPLPAARCGKRDFLREEGAMCYNCGCGKPGDDMGDPKNITDKTFEEAAKASKQSPKEAKRKTLELLKIILKKE